MQAAQIATLHNRVKEILVEIHRGTTGGHLGANKTVDKVRQHYYWLYLRGNIEMVPTV
jgi:hypothetical protein